MVSNAHNTVGRKHIFLYKIIIIIITTMIIIVNWVFAERPVVERKPRASILDRRASLIRSPSTGFYRRRRLRTRRRSYYYYYTTAYIIGLLLICCFFFFFLSFVAPCAYNGFWTPST